MFSFLGEIYETYHVVLNFFVTILYIEFSLIIMLFFEEIPSKYRPVFSVPFIIISYITYGVVSNDYLLECFSENVNPFSIMTSFDNVTFSLLVFKLTIAYLIYQFIISVRQNTRRK